MPFTHEQESQFKDTQIGAESTYGTAVPATVKLQSVTVNPALKRQFSKFKAKGLLLPTVGLPGTKWAEHSFEGMATFEELAYFVSDVVSDAQVAPVSYTIEHGGMVFPGAVVSAWNLSGDQDQVTLSGTMISKNKNSSTTHTTLASVDQNPVPGIGTAITINGVTQTRWFNWSVDVSDIWKFVFAGGNSEPINVAQGDNMVANFACLLEADTAGMTVVDLTGRQAVTIVMTSGSMSVTLAFDVIFEEPDQFSDQDGVYAIGVKGEIYNDATVALNVTIDSTP